MVDFDEFKMETAVSLNFVTLDSGSETSMSTVSMEKPKKFRVVDGVKTEVGTVLNKLFRGAGGGVSGDVGDRVRRRG